MNEYCLKVLRGWTKVDVSSTNPSHIRLTSDGECFDIEVLLNGVFIAWWMDGKYFLEAGSLCACVLACETKRKALGLEWADLPIGSQWQDEDDPALTAEEAVKADEVEWSSDREKARLGWFEIEVWKEELSPAYSWTVRDSRKIHTLQCGGTASTSKQAKDLAVEAVKELLREKNEAI